MRGYANWSTLRPVLERVVTAMEDQRAPSEGLRLALTELGAALDQMPKAPGTRWRVMSDDERALQSARYSERAQRAWANLPDARKAEICAARAEGARAYWRRRRGE